MKKGLIKFIIVCATVWGAADISRGFPEDRKDLQDSFTQAKEKYSHYRQTVKDITVLQDMEMDGPDGIVTQEAKLNQKEKKFRIDLGPGLSASETTAPDEKQPAVIYDGDTTWFFSQASEKQEVPYPESKKYQRDSMLWDCLLENGKALRDESVGNYDCFVVEVKDEQNVPYTLWIEKETFNLIQAESGSDEFDKINIWNSDFRKIDGDWEIPYRVEVYMDRKLVSTNTVKSVQVNQDLKDELFDPDHEMSAR